MTVLDCYPLWPRGLREFRMDWTHVKWHHVAGGGGGVVGFFYLVGKFIDWRDKRKLEQRNREWTDKLYREQLRQQLIDDRRRNELGRLD